jgi:hypothetical protein
LLQRLLRSVLDRTSALLVRVLIRSARLLGQQDSFTLTRFVLRSVAPRLPEIQTAIINIAATLPEKTSEQR